MQEEEKKLILTKIAVLKKELLMMRIGASSGEVAKGYKNKKKIVAQFFTKINKKSATKI
jgi:hypothetical protein